MPSLQIPPDETESIPSNSNNSISDSGSDANQLISSRSSGLSFDSNNPLIFLQPQPGLMYLPSENLLLNCHEPTLDAVLVINFLK